MKALFGIADILTALLVAFATFVALPTRWMPVDAIAVVLVALELLSGAALLLRAPWAVRLASAVAAVALAVGLTLVTSLGLTASWLAGVYGAVGSGGAIILTLVAALLLPYLVVLPAVKLGYLGGLVRRPEGER
jgi:hypothetical protein